MDLRRRRLERGLTLKQAAARIEVSIGHLAGIEMGHTEPSLYLAYRIARFYRTTIGKIWLEPRLHGT